MGRKKTKEVSVTIKYTPVFERNLKALQQGSRFILNQGGSRSSKTYSILQLLIYLALQKKEIITVVRKTLPSMKGSVIRDFFEILNDLELYAEKYHNKTENTYHFPTTGSEISFIGVDDEQKIRGRKSSLVYLNEANELDYETFLQLNLRSSGAIFIDYNPSFTEHWLNEVISRDNAILIKSTYKDNPFLPADQIAEIEGLIQTDYNYYRIYALGEKPNAESTIYSHFRTTSTIPDGLPHWYGLDFGYNHPTALVKVYQQNQTYYVEELVYQSKLTTADLITQMNLLQVDRGKVIYCDSARPEVIEEIARHGFKAKPANKAVKDGIDYIKSKPIFLLDTSTNLHRESKLYSWKTSKDGVIQDEPIKLNDDGMDALRYAIYSNARKSQGFTTQYTFI